MLLGREKMSSWDAAGEGEDEFLGATSHSRAKSSLP